MAIFYIVFFTFRGSTSQRAAAAVASIQQPHPIGTIATSGPFRDHFEDSKPELSHLAAAAAQHAHGANNVSNVSSELSSPAHSGSVGGVSSLGSLPGEYSGDSPPVQLPPKHQFANHMLRTVKSPEQRYQTKPFLDCK